MPSSSSVSPDLDPRLPDVARRFLRYVRIDTQSDPSSQSVPSTPKQMDLSRLLVSELRDLGVTDATMDDHGIVFATLEATATAPDGSELPVVALLAHVDTAPDAPGTGVEPLVHFAWDGLPIPLPGDPSVVLDPAVRPALARHVGEDVITSDGRTLLGSDDKAGVAVLVQLAADLVSDGPPRPRVRLCFTVDEEVGRGTDHLDLDRLGADVAYTVDGSDIDTISYETFHAASARVSIEGVGVHPGYAKGVMVNALRIASRLVASLPEAESPEHTEGGEGFIHPHTQSASDVHHAEVLLILRDFTVDGLERRKSVVRTIVESLRLSYPGVRITLEVQDQYPNMRSYIERLDPRTVSFAHDAAHRMGITLRAEAVRGGTDGARLSEKGLPTPNLFNGGMDYHSCFEWNTVQNLERTLDFVKHLLRTWADRGHEPVESREVVG